VQDGPVPNDATAPADAAASAVRPGSLPDLDTVAAGAEGARGAAGAPERVLAGLADALAADPRCVEVIDLPERAGIRTSWPSWVDPRVRDAYRRRGIDAPWRHQVRTADLAWSGRHVVLATGTASGKSAAFGMVGLTAALLPPSGTGGRGPGVLYISPTKALAHDQLAGLAALGLGELRAAAVDGDTPDEERRWARAHARWVVTNPDMLHRGILPGHDQWRGFLRSLRLVVVDEAHVYRGVFGSHVALVLRRLHRVAALHGAQPTFVAASATAADPGSTVGRLLGAPVEVVATDDSARGPVTLVLWRPGGSPPGGVEQRSGQPDPPAAERAGGHRPAEVGPPGVAAAAEEQARRGRAGPSPGAPAAAPGPSPAGARGGRASPARTPAGVDLPPEDQDSPTGTRGTLGSTAELMAAFVDRGVSTLAFVRSRRGVEVVAGRVRAEAVCGDRVRASRGGYLPEERRALERDLRDGVLLGLAATNALELGIDISGLDAVLMAGWPGTSASFWQQVGRAGRRGRAALAVLLAREDPLDQYLVDHPEMLTGRAVEATVLDPANPYVLAGHLCAAAGESPLRDDELVDRFGDGAPALCVTLADSGLLRRRRDGWYWTDSSRPADLVDLRGDAGGAVRVVEGSTGRLLGTVDPGQAPLMVHPGALYVHQGATYEVDDLDLAARVATADATVTDLSTHPRSAVDIRITSEREQVSWRGAGVHLGEVEVSSQVTSYLVRRWPSGQVLSEHLLDLPARSLHTTAMWWSIPEPLLVEAGIDHDELPGAVHALEHASIGMLPLLVTCDRWDLGGVSTGMHPQVGHAAIFVHDAHPGGAGFAEQGFARAAEWLTTTGEVIGRCPCATGCPRCVQSPKCGNGNTPLDKAAALRLARTLLRWSG
jgi:DEAD/DEAH box helicase domain-containing protein